MNVWSEKVHHDGEIELNDVANQSQKRRAGEEKSQLSSDWRVELPNKTFARKGKLRELNGLMFRWARSLCFYAAFLTVHSELNEPSRGRQLGTKESIKLKLRRVIANDSAGQFSQSHEQKIFFNANPLVNPINCLFIEFLQVYFFPSPPIQFRGSCLRNGFALIQRCSVQLEQFLL